MGVRSRRPFSVPEHTTGQRRNHRPCCARVAELADAPGVESGGHKPCRFKSCLGQYLAICAKYTLPNILRLRCNLAECILFP